MTLLSLAKPVIVMSGINFLNWPISQQWNRRWQSATCTMASANLHTFSSLRSVVILYNKLHQYSSEDMSNGLLKIATCFKQRNNSTNVFICRVLPRDDIYSVNSLLIKKTNIILKSLWSRNHINAIDQDKNWIRMICSLKLDLS